MVDVTHLRRSYAHVPLREEDTPKEPLALFAKWMDEAAAQPEPNAMTLATVDADGQPQARVVLLRGYDARGWVFYTNYESDKARELAAHPRASLLFFWPELTRQIRLCGSVARVSDAESDAYFASRPRGHQLGAWASRQSRTIASREALEAEMRSTEARFPDAVPRPPHWGGFRLSPSSIEFWQGQENRLHDRLRYVLREGAWQRERLSP